MTAGGIFKAPSASVARYAIGGLINTLITYVLYLLLNIALPYHVAFLFSYLFGIVLSYFISSIFVFRVALSRIRFLSFPIVYIAQYLISASLLTGLIEGLTLHESVAPILVTIITIPITYALSKFVLTAEIHQEKSSTLKRTNDK